MMLIGAFAAGWFVGVFAENYVQDQTSRRGKSARIGGMDWGRRDQRKGKKRMGLWPPTSCHNSGIVLLMSGIGRVINIVGTKPLMAAIVAW